MDRWFEEDEEVYVHPHNPYKRIDILHSSRHVEVEVNGVKIADTHRPTLLFETSLPTRYYIPKLDVRMDLLIPTDTARAAHTRASPHTGPSMQAARRSRTWPGRTRRRSPRTSRSPGWSRSTTSGLTSSWTANARRDQRPSSREPSY